MAGYMGKLEIALGLSVFMIAASASASEYYTWVDENGVTNYSEKNPQGYDAQHVTPQSRFGYRYQSRTLAPESDAGPAEEEAPTDPAEMTDEQIDQQIASERARIDQEIARAKASNCKIGQRNLAQLEAYARVRVRDDDGQARVLTDSEKADRIAQARNTIRENCTG